MSIKKIFYAFILLFFFFNTIVVADTDYPEAPKVINTNELGSLSPVEFIQNQFQNTDYKQLSVTPLIEENNRIILHYTFRESLPGFAAMQPDVTEETLVYEKNNQLWKLSASFSGLLDASEFVLKEKEFKFTSFFPLSYLAKPMSPARIETLEKRLNDKALDWFDLSVGENDNNLQVALAVVEHGDGVKIHWLRKDTIKVLDFVFSKETSFRNFILKDQTLIFTLENKNYIGTYAWNPKENIKSIFSKNKKNGQYYRFPKGEVYIGLKDAKGIKTFFYALASATNKDFFYDNILVTTKHAASFKSKSYNNDKQEDGYWMIPDLNGDGIREFIKISVDIGRYSAIGRQFDLYNLFNKQFISTGLNWYDYEPSVVNPNGDKGELYTLSFDMIATPYPTMILTKKVYKNVDSLEEIIRKTLSETKSVYQWNSQENKIKLIK